MPAEKPGVLYVKRMSASPAGTLTAIKPTLTFKISASSPLTVADQPPSHGTLKKIQRDSVELTVAEKPSVSVSNVSHAVAARASQSS